MHRRPPSCFPCLLVLAGIALASAAGAADTDQAIDHEVRNQESGEKSLGALTASTAKQIDALVDEYSYNQVCDGTQATVLHRVARSLDQLADPAAKAQARNMPWVQTQLGAARSGGDSVSALSQASEGQGEVIEHIDSLLKQAQQVGVLSHVQTLEALHKHQQRLQREVIQLTDQTVGKAVEELSVQERVEENRQGVDQHNQVQALTDCIAQLLAPLPPDQQDAELSRRQGLAAAALASSEVGRLMQEAAVDIKQAKMEEAVQVEQKIIENIERAIRLLSAEPDIDALDELEQRQQKLLDADAKLASADARQAYLLLQTSQSELAKDIHDNDDVRAATPDAEHAASELGQQAARPAAADMQKVIDLIRAVREKIRARTGGKLESASADPGGAPDGTCPATTPLWQQELEKTRNHEAWKVGLTPSGREVLSTSANESFPSAYAEELTQYYRELAAGSSDTP